jgi:hypothetical protein
MQVTLTLPDEIADGLGRGGEISSRILESVVLQCYLRQEISLGRFAELLGLKRIEAEAFLDRNNARLPCIPEMLKEDHVNCESGSNIIYEQYLALGRHEHH